MDKNIIILLSILSLGNLFFLGFRNFLVFEWRSKSREAISKYCDTLISKRKYDIEINYYNTMQIEYFKHVFSFWLWGAKSGLKPKYKELLEPYFY